MRVEPEHVLEQHGVAAVGRVEESDMESPFQNQQEQRNRNDRRSQNLNHAGGVMRPHEQRQTEPGQARRAHPVNGDDEVEAGQDRRKSGDKIPSPAAIT